MRKHDAPVEGLYPGVVAIVGDANMLCLDCAFERYSSSSIRDIINYGISYPDREGNDLTPVLYGSEDTRDIDAEHDYAREHPRARPRIISRYCDCGAWFYH